MKEKTKQKVQEIIVIILAAIILPLLIAVFFFVITGTPDVVFSYETGKCVKVEYADGSLGDCDHLPGHFNHVWGK